MTANPEILAVGYACVDFITVVDRLPILDEKMIVDNLLIQGGGPSATAMVAASRLGARVSIVASIADDVLGREIIAGLEREKVDVSLSPIRNVGRSAFAFLMIDRQSGYRTIVGRQGDIISLRAKEVPKAQIKKAKVLFVDGNEPEAQFVAAQVAKKAGVPVIFDAGNEKAGMEELIPFTDVLIASRGFGRDVGGSEDPAKAAKAFFAQGGLSVAAVTAGADGAYFETAQGAFHQKAFKVKVVDTTGAGDAFHGAYAFGMARKWAARECARFASAVAAMKCTKVGGRTGLPKLAEVEVFLREHAEA